MAGEDDRTGHSGFKWWRDLPGWVQAVAALLTLLGIGGVGSAVIHATGSKPQPQHTAGPSTPAAQYSVAGGRPVWSGPIAISSNGGGIDLDFIPPTSGPNSLIFDQINGFRSSTGNYHMAQWNGASTPSRDQCTRFVDAHQYTSLPAQPGSAYCLLTGAGHTAYLQVTNIDANLDNGTVYARVTIWDTTGHSVAPPASSAPQAKELYSSSISISSNSGGADLGSNPPVYGSNNLIFDPVNGFRSSTGKYTIAPWNGGTPAYSQCHAWAVTHVIASAPAHVGSAYCLLTGEGNTAYMTVTGINPTLDNGTATVHLVVWTG